MKSKDKRKKGLIATAYQNSLIISSLNSLSASIHKAVGGSALSRAFCSAEKLDTAKNSSMLKRTTSSLAVSQLFSRAKAAFARLVEGSSIVALYRRIINAVMCAYVRDLGIFLLSFGLFSLSSTLLKVFMLDASGNNADSGVICTAALLVAAIPLLASKKSIASKLAGSAIFSFIISDILGISLLTLRTKTDVQSRAPAALAAGTILGTLSFIFAPEQLVLAILMLIFTLTLLYSPESGLLLSLVLQSFVPYSVLRVIVFAAAASYLLKLLRGKRNIAFSATDTSVLIFAVAVLCAMGMKSLVLVLVGCTLYMLTVNLVRSLDLLEKGINAISLGLAVSSVASAVIAVLEQLGITVGDSLALLIRLETGSAAALTLTSLPFSLLMLHKSKTPLSKAAAFVFFASVTTNAVLSFSESIWWGYAIVLFIYAAVRTAKLPSALLGTLLTAPFGVALLMKLSIVNDVIPFEITPLFGSTHWSVLVFGGAPVANDASLLSALCCAGGIVLLVLLALTVFCLLSSSAAAAGKSRLPSVRLVCGSLATVIAALIYISLLPGTLNDTQAVITVFCSAGLLSCSGSVFARRSVTEDY